MATTRTVAGEEVMIQVGETTSIIMILLGINSVMLEEGWMEMPLMDIVTGTGIGMCIGTDRNSHEFHSQSFLSLMAAVLGKVS